MYGYCPECGHHLHRNKYSPNATCGKCGYSKRVVPKTVEHRDWSSVIIRLIK